MRFEEFQKKWGIEKDISKCIGRTIKKVELLRMEYGCIFPSAWLIKFTDDTRVMFHGQVGMGSMKPTMEELHNSKILTPDEYADLMKDERAKQESRDRDRQRRKEEEFENLAKELGRKVT